MSSLEAIDATREAQNVGALAQKKDTGRVLRSPRRALASLLDRDDGEYLLADTGLDREAARNESRKPFWQE